MRDISSSLTHTIPFPPSCYRSSLKSKLKQDANLLEKKKADVGKRDDRIKELEKEIAEYGKTRDDLVKEYEDLKSSADVKLTAEQEEEYGRVREMAAAASAEPRRRCLQRQRVRDTCRNRVDQIRQELEQVREPNAAD